ncbi:class I SAM-dependent methyltransferase [Nocardioides zeicaulis]|uniref:Class I SAM-dependent methyltransferase n=1 Tax=Nocardioides zeicaulis TaxID=1776857 RepID=A0ABV6E469_9ACTN
MAEALWVGVAEAYARSFAGLCAGAVPTLLDGLPAGCRLVDVGCGTGTLVAAARERGHDVVAVEPDPDMAGLAADRLGTEVVLGGLPDLPLADSGFEAVTASFVLNHVEDPRAGARELARVAAPGGVVRATTWGATPAPQAVMWAGILDAAGAVRAPSPRLAPDKDFERSPAGLADVLTSVGLAVTRAGVERWTWRVRADDLWSGLTSVGNFGVAWRQQADDVRDRVRAAYDEHVSPWRDGDALAFDVECVLVEARVPRA